MGMRSDFLFARPSFWSGVARVLDLFGVFDSYNSSRTPGEVDARALYADWSVAGSDLIAASEDVRTAGHTQRELFPAPAA